jgi:hypothetical protein
MSRRPVHLGALLVVGVSTLSLFGCSSVAPATEEYSGISIQPVLDGAKRVQACVAKRGFTVSVRPTGELEYTDKQVPEKQAKLADAAIAACQKENPIGRSDAWPREKLPKLYALELAEQACLKALDLAVDDPPSLQRFIDTYRTAEAWSARGSALARNTLTQETYDRLTITCPDPEVLGTP